MKKIKGREDIDVETINKVLYWFFAYPSREIGLSDLANETKIAKTTANRIVRNMEKAGVLEVTRIGKVWRIKVNQENGLYRQMKVAYNVGRIYREELKERILEYMPNPQTIVLFGSCRYGTDTEKSDIDIAVEVIGDGEMQIIEIGGMDLG